MINEQNTQTQPLFYYSEVAEKIGNPTSKAPTTKEAKEKLRGRVLGVLELLMSDFWSGALWEHTYFIHPFKYQHDGDFNWYRVPGYIYYGGKRYDTPGEVVKIRMVLDEKGNVVQPARKHREYGDHTVWGEDRYLSEQEPGNIDGKPTADPAPPGLYRDTFADVCRVRGITKETPPQSLATIPISQYEDTFITAYCNKLLLTEEGMNAWRIRHGIKPCKTLRPAHVKEVRVIDPEKPHKKTYKELPDHHRAWIDEAIRQTNNGPTAYDDVAYLLFSGQEALFYRFPDHKEQTAKSTFDRFLKKNKHLWRTN